MKSICFLIGLFFIVACDNQEQSKIPTPEQIEDAKKYLLEDDENQPFLGAEDSQDEEKGVNQESGDSISKHNHGEYVALYYVLITDTGLDYFELRKKMFEVSELSKLPIDTLEREFNTEKQLIALPIDDPDPSYAGEYFQRRFPSNSLSLEYLNAYQNTSNEKTIALVAGIFEKEKLANEALEKIKPISNGAFIVKAQVYIGCIH